MSNDNCSRWPTEPMTSRGHADTSVADRADAYDGFRFDCPNCGHDNVQPFAKRYPYWQVETE